MAKRSPARRPAPQIRHGATSLPAEPRVHQALRRQTSHGIRVRATRVGYYGEKLRRVDDVFTVTDRRDEFGKIMYDDKKRPMTAENLLGSWMERVDGDVPERLTSHNQVIKQEHDDILADRASAGQTAAVDNPTGDADPLGYGDE